MPISIQNIWCLIIEQAINLPLEMRPSLEDVISKLSLAHCQGELFVCFGVDAPTSIKDLLKFLKSKGAPLVPIIMIRLMENEDNQIFGVFFKSVGNYLYGIEWQLNRLSRTKPKILYHINDDELSSKINGQSIVIISGGPGSGKTELAKRIVQGVKSEKIMISIAAPTGQAVDNIKARIVSSETQCDLFFSTLHKLIDDAPTKPQPNKSFKNPLIGDVIIVDECSMLSLHALSYLLESIPKGSQLILMGDPQQLPPVGEAAIFDLIVRHYKESNISIQLKSSMRFSSSIKSAIDQMNGGSPLKEIDLIRKNSSFYLDESDLATKIIFHSVNAWSFLQQDASEATINRMFENFKSFIILSTHNHGVGGVDRVNGCLYQYWHQQFEKNRNTFLFVPIFINENSKDGNFFNGTFGFLVKHQQSSRYIFMQKNQPEWAAKNSDMLSFSYGYSRTIDKSQGSEYESVLLIWGKSRGYKAFFTAITRSKLNILIMQSKEAEFPEKSSSEIGIHPFDFLLASRATSTLEKMVKL